MSLGEIRKKIDEIDSKLIPLFVDRMECSEKVAEDKIKNNLPILNIEREKQVLEKVGAKAGKYPIEAKMLYNVMMALSRMHQHKLMNSGLEERELIEEAIKNRRTLKEMASDRVIACVGNGSYGNMAAVSLFPDNDIVFLDSHSSVFDKLKNGEIDIGILPVENSSAGSVTEVYDLILKYRYCIVAATTVRVSHCIAAPKGAVLEDIKKVASHPQALSQCSRFIENRGFITIQSPNTAIAAAEIAELNDKNCAVICSELAAKKYGLEILEKNIQNISNNQTRFIAIKKQLAFPTEADKISLCFSLDHATGTLYSVLGRFAMHGLNLTKIESRPARNSTENFQYDFYLDFSGSVCDEQTLDLICELSTELEHFSFIGNYFES